MKKQILAIAVAAASVASLQAAPTTIVNFSTGGTNVPGYSSGYFNAGNGWTAPGFWGGQNGWTQSGNADAVSVQTGYSPGAGNASGSLGVDYLPNNATIYVQKTFTPMSTVTFTNIAASFVTEFAVAELFAANANDDTFRFSLRNGNQVALSLDLQAPALLGYDYTLSSHGFGAPVNQFALAYDSVYRMQIDVASNGAWTGNLYTVTDPTNARTIALVNAFTGGTLNFGKVASDLDNLRVSWVLDSGDTNNLGTIGLIVNEATFSSTGTEVPEPGTWAMAALLMSGAAATIYRRRKAAKETAVA
jgi:hypothetical protein